MNPPLSSRCRWLSSIVRTSPAVGRKSCQRARRLARTGQRLRARQHTPAALADALRQELAPWRVKVVVIEPASINSSAAGNVTRNAAMAAAPRGRILYDDAFGKMLAVVMQRREDADSPPDVAAATITRALTAARPRNVYLTGKYSRRLALLACCPAPARRRMPARLRTARSRIPRLITVPAGSRSGHHPRCRAHRKRARGSGRAGVPG